VSQGEFLKRLGIEARAARLSAKVAPESAGDISSALQRLIGGGRGGMGSMFKVLAVSVANLTSLVGFNDEEQDAKAVPP
jgi:SAM-dependent MidA family methyltransferase